MIRILSPQRDLCLLLEGAAQEQKVPVPCPVALEGVPQLWPHSLAILKKHSNCAHQITAVDSLFNSERTTIALGKMAIKSGNRNIFAKVIGPSEKIRNIRCPWGVHIPKHEDGSTQRWQPEVSCPKAHTGIQGFSLGWLGRIP